MDQQQQQNVNQAAQEWTEAVRQSFQTLADQMVNLQESNLKLTQSFFQQFVQQLQSPTQGNRQDLETLKQQAFETLAQESANAYSDFLHSALSFYQQTLQQATQATQSSLQTANQVAQEAVQARSQAAQESAGAAGQAAQESTRAATQVAQQSMRAATQVAHQTTQDALAPGRTSQGVFASDSGRKDASPTPISGPHAWADHEPASSPPPSKYAAPDRAAAIQLIDELLSEDSSYDEETWPEIAEALDRDRPSHRKLFVE